MIAFQRGRKKLFARGVLRKYLYDDENVIFNLKTSMMWCINIGGLDQPRTNRRCQL